MSPLTRGHAPETPWAGQVGRTFSAAGLCEQSRDRLGSEPPPEAGPRREGLHRGARLQDHVLLSPVPPEEAGDSELAQFFVQTHILQMAFGHVCLCLRVTMTYLGSEPISRIDSAGILDRF